MNVFHITKDASTTGWAEHLAQGSWDQYWSLASSNIREILQHTDQGQTHPVSDNATTVANRWGEMDPRSTHFYSRGHPEVGGSKLGVNICHTLAVYLSRNEVQHTEWATSAWIAQIWGDTFGRPIRIKTQQRPKILLPLPRGWVHGSELPGTRLVIPTRVCISPTFLIPRVIKKIKVGSYLWWPPAGCKEHGSAI